MNNTQQLGRLTRDPELRVKSGAKGDLSITSFSIAVPRRFKTDEVDFFECSAFGGKAVFIEKNFKKGQQIAITGYLRQDRWTDKDGALRSKVQIVVEEANFAGSISSAAQSDSAQNPIPTPVPEPEMDIPDDYFEDLPFADDIEIVQEEIKDFLGK